MIDIKQLNIEPHSQKDITAKCRQLRLNNCEFHHCRPKILKIVAENKKTTFYVAICEAVDCTILTENLEDTLTAWNIHNLPIELPEEVNNPAWILLRIETGASLQECKKIIEANPTGTVEQWKDDLRRFGKKF